MLVFSSGGITTAADSNLFKLPTEDLDLDLLDGEQDLEFGESSRAECEEGTSGGVQPLEDLPELLL